MEEKAVFDFVNEMCKQNDTDFEASFTKLLYALEREKERRRDEKREKLINAFEEAYKELRKAHIRIKYDIDPEMVNTSDYYRQPYELDEFDCFSFI